MGAKSIDLELETLEGSGGYAREMTEDRADRQRELLAPYIANADALITTAAVPGRTAPMLVTAEMVEQMKPGLRRGRPRRRVRRQRARARWPARSSGSATRRSGVATTCPSQMPGPASKLYAQNLVNLLTLMTNEGEFAPDFEDEVVAGRRGHPRRPDRARADPGGDRGAAAEPDHPVVAEPEDRAPARNHRPRTTSSSISPSTRRPSSERRRRLADDLRPQRVRGHRGDLQGLLDPAHPADVGRQRDPRDHPARRDHRHRHHRQRRGRRRRPGRDRAGGGEHGRRLRGDRPDAADVHAQEEEAGLDDRRGGPPSDAHLGPADLPRLRGLLHPRAQGPLRSEDRPHRQPDRRRRRRGRLRRPVLLPRPRRTSR